MKNIGLYMYNSKKKIFDIKIIILFTTNTQYDMITFSFT